MSIETILASIPNLDRAKRSGMRANAEAKLGNPEMAADARRVLEALDAQIAAEIAELAEHVRVLPRTQRVIEAFTHWPMTETERKIVQVLLHHPGLSSEGLSREIGWGAQSWHMHFGEMCRKRESRLWPADSAVVRDAAFYSGILADWSETDGWRMKPDVAEAFAALGVLPRGDGAK